MWFRAMIGFVCTSFWQNVCPCYCSLCILTIANFHVFQSNDWIRVRIQQMEPDLMEVGATLDEAIALRREHDDLLTKLNVSLFLWS